MATRLKLLITVALVATIGSPTLHAQAPKPPVIQSLADLDRCAQQNSYDTGVCLEPLEKYARGRPASEQMQIAKRARLQFKHWVALRFFEPALGKTPTAAQCGDEDLALAVVAGLALPASFPEKATAEKLFQGACFVPLRPAVEKALVGASGGYLPDHACPIFKAKGAKVAGCVS
jgi:hypothetical protein